MVLIQDLIPFMQLVVFASFDTFDTSHDEILIVIREQISSLFGLHIECLTQSHKDQFQGTFNL